MLFEVAVFVLCLFAVLKFISLSWQSRERRYLNYRFLKAKSIARLESLTIRLTDLGAQAEQGVNSQILDKYLESLDKMESLLTALNQMPILTFDHKLLNSLVPMVNQIESDVVKAEEQIKRGKKTLSIRGKQGCYFCSKPAVREFKDIKISAKGNQVKVLSCQICRAALKSRGEVPVLYFRKDSEMIHWSEFEGYDPWRDYWTVSRLKNSANRSNIKLIHSEIESD